ncbi:cytochrome c [Motiliproteus coralliicola]|uniref:Cytochrome c n=1 Tax=Motiliproteus coralliicola TaxID=2283196 RepID=A0A369WL99_9GAMM|nr:cytochrome c [Motiliproteus coralliicola]RDE22482.1 cytochrome c [Motiliproteus coralliicola]
MADNFTKGMARNIYYGGGLFFFLFFVGLTFDTMLELPKRDNRDQITDTVVHGKKLWEDNNCIGCHSLMGEGAYFAPELANVYDRYGAGNEQAFKQFMQSWMAMQPLPAEGRRKMPQFNLSTEEVDALSDFLIWTSRINDNDWPPNKQG